MGQHQNRFGQRELHPDAASRTGPKRQIGETVRLDRVRQKPPGMESGGIAPQTVVPMENPGGDVSNRSGRKRMSGKLVGADRLSHDDVGGRIEPQRFLDDRAGGGEESPALSGAPGGGRGGGVGPSGGGGG